MPPASIPVVVAVLLAAAIGGYGKAVTLTLERANHEGVELSRLRERDRVRHGRFLQQQLNGVVDFPVGGTYNPFVAGLYYTRVKLGTPQREFYVQIDTGSDVLWVSCNPCSGCPKSSGLKEIKLEVFDPSTSTTASVISCNDKTCALGGQYSEASCSSQNQCGYKFTYGDGSGASGYYVSDTMYLDTIVAKTMSNSSTSVVFGCSTSLTGDLTKADSAVDGIFGFGQNGLSVVAQLSSQGITPNAFSHCLSGQNGGGGILVLGQVVDLNVTFTPLVQSQPHYNVNLESISVNGQMLSINPSVFATSDTTGTIVDSGTTLAYFADGAYDPIINAIMQTVSPSMQSVPSKEAQCFLTTSSISDIFPNISLNFANGASMVMMPQDYLLQQNAKNGATIWCIAIQKTQGQEITILGDIVLKDKVVVYDIAGQRIGWTSYDCSSTVNVSTSNTDTTESVNAGHLNRVNNSSSRLRFKRCMLLHSIAMALLLHTAFFGVHMFSKL